MNKQELIELAELKRGEIVGLRMDFSNGKSEGNVRQIRGAKKDLARILTIMTIKEKNDK